jgi:hypothetical protein
MEKSYFIYSSGEKSLKIERFHICTWEFSDSSFLVEFGAEIDFESINGKEAVEVSLFVPWLNKNCIVEDFYEKLSESSNSRFIFNDAIVNTVHLDDGQGVSGVIHNFLERGVLCVLPIVLNNDLDQQKVKISIDLQLYNRITLDQKGKRPNIYFRFCITPNDTRIHEIKKGITKSTILYDIRINQRRNIPAVLMAEILRNHLCEISTCFCFNIIPNTHDLSFFDSSTLQNVRTLEFDSFSLYLGNKVLTEKDLLVVFNKDKRRDSYAFFSIYSKEHIGIDQLSIALIINLVAGILLFLASVDFTLIEGGKKFSIADLPFTFWVVVASFLWMLYYFLKRRFRWFTKKSMKK